MFNFIYLIYLPVNYLHLKYLFLHKNTSEVSSGDLPLEIFYIHIIHYPKIVGINRNMWF